MLSGFPVSIDFFASMDLDFICCSPDYLPTAKVLFSKHQYRHVIIPLL
jgi:hypothetical protein